MGYETAVVIWILDLEQKNRGPAMLERKLPGICMELQTTCMIGLNFNYILSKYPYCLRWTPSYSGDCLDDRKVDWLRVPFTLFLRESWLIESAFHTISPWVLGLKVFLEKTHIYHVFTYRNLQMISKY